MWGGGKCEEESTGLTCRAISARAKTFKFNQFVSKLRVRFLACFFFSVLVAFRRFLLLSFYLSRYCFIVFLPIKRACF